MYELSAYPQAGEPFFATEYAGFVSAMTGLGGLVAVDIDSETAGDRLHSKVVCGGVCHPPQISGDFIDRFRLAAARPLLCDLQLPDRGFLCVGAGAVRFGI